MKILISLLLANILLLSQTLSFGAISTVDNKIMEKKLTPLINYISKVLSKDLKFETGFDYSDTIEKFRNSKYDFGFIGPSPYVFATKDCEKPIKIIVGINNRNNGTFYSAIIVKKGSSIKKLSDLQNKTFAFGSPKSTLSYVMPMNLLKKNNLQYKISKFVFLGKHDKVAKYIIMGKYDAGGIKASVAKKYHKYLTIIDRTIQVPDFMIVASSNISDKTIEKIRNALLKPEAQKLAKFIKPSATGFRFRKDSDYDELRVIMDGINNKK
jgi:phosphonate transport system substrate-binding protein